MRLNFYQKAIIEATGCHPEDAEITERYMRLYIVGGPLDALSKTDFKLCAVEAFNYMRECEAV